MDNDVLCQEAMPGVHPTNGISIEFEILSKFGVLYLKICISYHNKIFHTSLKLHCHDVCKIWLWSEEYTINQSNANVGWILNSTEILLVGLSPGRAGR